MMVRLAWVMKNSRQALREEDGETGREIDAGGAHGTRVTDDEVARADATPRENDAQLDIYSRSVVQRMPPSPTAVLEVGVKSFKAVIDFEGGRRRQDVRREGGRAAGVSWETYASSTPCHTPS